MLITEDIIHHTKYFYHYARHSNLAIPYDLITNSNNFLHTFLDMNTKKWKYKRQSILRFVCTLFQWYEANRQSHHLDPWTHEVILIAQHWSPRSASRMFVSIYSCLDRTVNCRSFNLCRPWPSSQICQIVSFKAGQSPFLPHESIIFFLSPFQAGMRWHCPK